MKKFLTLVCSLIPYYGGFAGLVMVGAAMTELTGNSWAASELVVGIMFLAWYSEHRQRRCRDPQLDEIQLELKSLRTLTLGLSGDTHRHLHRIERILWYQFPRAHKSAQAADKGDSNPRVKGIPETV